MSLILIDINPILLAVMEINQPVLMIDLVRLYKYI